MKFLKGALSVLFYILPILLIIFVFSIVSEMNHWSPFIPGYNYAKWSTVFLIASIVFCLLLYIPTIMSIKKNNLKLLLVPFILAILFIFFGISLNTFFKNNYISNINPNDVQSVLRVANSYLDINDNDNAIIYFNKAIEITPNDPAIFHDRGLAYYGNEEYEKAILDYSAAISLNSNIAQFYNDRAVAYYFIGDYQKSKSDINQAIKMGYRVNPGFIEALDANIK